MADDPKSLIDLLLNTVKSSIPRSKINFTYDMNDEEDSSAEREATSIKALLMALGSWAGKGKDEIVQILAREVGVAVAAMLKEPVTQILENRRLQITLDLVAKSDAKKAAPESSQKKKASSKRKTPSS